MEWEYKVLTTDQFVSEQKDLNVQQQLNMYGKEGWELVGSLDRTYPPMGTPSKLDQNSIVFKRSKRS
ncbi:MAG: DUF4177 domain-containing protein [Cellulosilyticaceae bacterium]